MNAVVAEKESSDVVEFRAPGPGERLRNARMARDMDIRKIAEKLHLTTDMVDAIECDDYSELPARVFVRGYIRNYARVVELPADSIMAQFDELWPEDKAKAKVKIDRAPRLPADTRPGSRWSGAITWLLLLAGIALFLMWWQGYLDRFTQTGNQTASLEAPAAVEGAQPESAPTGLVLPPAGPGSQSQPQSQPSLEGENLLRLPPVPASRPVTEAPASVEAAAPEKPLAVDSLEGIAAALERSEVSLPLPPAEATSVAEVAAEAAPVSQVPAAAQVSEPVAAVPTPTPVEPVAQKGVLVTFNDDCWVDIRGANRSFKLFGTMRKGTEKLLEGKPPYKFVLGNAAAVSVSVNGKPFDLAAHTKDNVARFSLSP